MEKRNIIKFLIFSSSIFILNPTPSQSANSCEPESCDSNLGPQVRFPFRLLNRQPARCGYPGFDLYCNTKNQTILNLRESGEFIVDYINYKTQSLFIDDPSSCLSKRALNFSLSGSPYRAAYLTRYAFLNCSGSWADYGWSDGDYVPLFCLSEGNYTVVASSPAGRVPPRCRRIASVTVPPWWTFRRSDRWAVDLKEDFQVDWREPACGKCENRGGVCGLKGDSGLQIGCSKTSGLSRSVKYAIIVGVGIPGLLCTIGLSFYILNKLKIIRHQHLQNSDPPTTTVFDQRPAIRATSGLELTTIDSYPKTVLGQSRRLPKPGDSTCPICLCEYQPKETLRSIPECSHYFHVDCIDEWLKLNGTCPLCRNSLEDSSNATSCFSTPLSSSSSS